MVHSLKEALGITINKQKYSNAMIPQLINLLKNGDYSYIVRDYNAREYVKSLSKEQLQMQIDNLNNKHSDLDDITFVIEKIINLSNLNRQDIRLESYVCEELIKIFNNEATITLEDGRIFSSESLKNAMLEKCIIAGNERTQNAGLLYEYDMNANIESFDQVAFLSGSCKSAEPIRQAIETNATFSGHILGEFITSTLKKGSKTDDYNLNDSGIRLNIILNGLNLDVNQKAYILANKIIEDEVGYIQSCNVNLANRLNDLPANKLKLNVVLNALNLFSYSSSKPTIDNNEMQLYSDGNSNKAEVQNIIIKNREIQTNIYLAAQKYGIDGIAQYLSNISVADMQFLCHLYVTSNSNVDKQRFMDDLDTIRSNYEIEVLKSHICNKELFQKLEETKGRNNK